MVKCLPTGKLVLITVLRTFEQFGRFYNGY